MAKLYNGGYTYPNGISVAARKPLDDRLVLNSVEDLYINSSTRNAGTAVLNKIAYTGMPVIIANNGNPYVVLLKNLEPYENGSTTEVNASNYTTYWTITGKSVEDYISGTIDPSINKLETEIAQHGNKLNNYADTFPKNPVASSESNGLMSAADKAKVDNCPEQFVLDLGIVERQEDGERAAARSEVAGNRNISFIRFQVHGVQNLKTTLIMQWPNGINETAQIMCVDKQQWRRNVTGATGVVGAPTNAFKWERTAPHSIVYDEQRRIIQLKDYQTEIVSQGVELPLVTSSKPGLMRSTDKIKLDRLVIDTTWNERQHMNAFTETGEYHIHGIRTRDNDGLPIINSGGGHTIDARLTVLDSSLTNGTGENTDICVTQVLRLSNRTGADGHVYVRTGQAATKAELKATGSTKWGTWEKLMGIFEKNAVTNIDDLNTYTTNGMYSGLFTNAESKFLGGLQFNQGDTFLIVTVNGYAASAFGTPQLTQMLYLLPSKQDSGESSASMYMRTAYWDASAKTWTWADWNGFLTANDFLKFWAEEFLPSIELMLKGGDGVTWNSSSHINSFVDSKNYYIEGERTHTNDGLPILNTGTFFAQLSVLDSSLTNGTDVNTDICVTQVLRLSNRTGERGHVYVRTGRAATKAELKATDSTKWGTWEKLMGIFEKNAVTNIDDLNTYTADGMYSGLFTNAESKFLGGLQFNQGDTFLIVTLNKYAASALGIQQLTQMLYLLPKTNDNVTPNTKMYLRTAYWKKAVGPKRLVWTNWDRIITASELSDLEERVAALETRVGNLEAK